MMADFATLIARVGTGKGQDRRLDADICVALEWIGHEDFSLRNIKASDAENRYSLTYSYVDGSSWYESPTPNLTSSLDAIRALFKERLEGWIVRIDDHTRARAVCQVLGDDKMFFTKHPDVHRAFLSATLKAIAAKEG